MTRNEPATAVLMSPQFRLRPGDFHDSYRDSQQVRDRLAEASGAIGVDLAAALLTAGEDELNQGAVARPLIVALSSACYREAVASPPDYLAGLSLGQVTAAHLAGCLSFPDAVRMAHAMATVEADEFPGDEYGVSFYSQVDVERLITAAATLSDAGDYVRPCAVVADDQVILTGTRTGLGRLAVIAFAMGGAGVPIPYGPPAHCDLMAGVRRRFEAEWAPQDGFRDPAVPLVCNLTAAPLRTAAQVRAALAAQYTTTVRWSESLRAMADLGVRRVVVPGPGAFVARSLATMALPFTVTTGAGVPA